jgi:hypothetical protein
MPGAEYGWPDSSSVGSVRRPSGVEGWKPRRPPDIIMSGTFSSGPSSSSTVMSTMTGFLPPAPPTTTGASCAQAGTESATAIKAEESARNIISP